MKSSRCFAACTTELHVTTRQTYTTQAINLKSYPLKESDKIVVMYSKDKGIIRAVAKGIKKPKSSLGARMDAFIANTLLLAKGRNMDVVSQAETVNSFGNTRKDLDKIFYSMYLTEVVNNFGVENDPCSAETYNALYSALKAIADAAEKKDILLTVLKFQLKMMYISGFSPEFNICLKCGCKIDDSAYFMINEGGIICPECVNDSRGKLIIHNKIREFLNYLVNADFNAVTDYEIKATEKVCEVCFNLLKKCIEQHSAKKIKTTEILAAI